MASYQYRHTLDLDPNDPDFTEEGRAILRAAFMVATLAHDHMSRDKNDSQWKYITHPLMAYDILRRLGEKDPVVLASMLLHDSVEKDSEFEARPDLLDTALESVLYREGVRGVRSEEVRTHLLSLIREVTNPEVFPHSKEVYQVDRVAMMSFDAKKVKVADQVSSLICNLTMENDLNAFPMEKAEGFAEKAESLVTAILRSVAKTKDEEKELRPLGALSQYVAKFARQLVDAPDKAARETLRGGFDFDVAIAEAKKRGARNRPLVPALEPVHHQEFFTQESHRARWEAMGSGITRVDFNAKGKVMGYVMWEGPDQNHAQAGAVMQAMNREVREMRKASGPHDMGTYDTPDPKRGRLLSGSTVGVTTLEGHHLGRGRYFELMPSVNAESFGKAALAAGVCNAEDAMRIANASTEIHRNQRSEAIRMKYDFSR